jgi:hypothetical protein
LPTPRLIGLLYFDNVELNANANIFASAFVELGGIGMLLASAGAGIVLGLFRGAPGVGTTRLAALGAVWCCCIWSQQALHTSLLSGGVILFAILVLLGGEGSRVRAKQ